MTETIARMFALMGTDATQLAQCWTEGKADPELISAYVSAGRPIWFSADSEHTTARDGVILAAVRVKASWAGAPPFGWDHNGEQTVVMRQQRDWGWTIDTIQPRTRDGQGNAHCAMCHRGSGRP